ncbi:putative sodium/potassium/calcium exchanger [Methanoplanus limicola]|uniref:Uncharacterized protein n=1 Tax=Methanoplanus limicola DSM 2279 TaxID=937775 RepID=H1Z4C8_9EURY|nr:hypothetical protein [Methanoplanus limicola]EHQ36676.1 hypothetical protein Metlim_2635 [Methanoplanus limicola DSM 2279]
MAGMSDSRRRMIMMLTIIFAGSALTFIDLSPLLVLVIAVVMGIVMLFALGMVTFGEIKSGLKAFRHRLSQPVTFKKKEEDKKSGKEKPPKEPKEDAKKDKEKKGGLFSGKGDKESKVPFAGLMAKLPFGRKKDGEDQKKEVTEDKGKSESAGLFAGVGTLFSSLKSGKKSREEKQKKIDELLDHTVNDVVPSAPGTKDESSEDESQDDISDSGEDEDDFSDFDSLDLGIEEESDEDFDSSVSSILQAEEEIPESTIAEILAKEGIDLELEDDEFSGISEINDETDSSEELSGSPSGSEEISGIDEDISGLEFEGGDEFDELGDLDDLDLDEIEIDEEDEFEPEEEVSVELGDESGDGESASPDISEEEEDIFAAPPKEWEQGSFGLMSQDSEEESFTASFEKGSDDGDLFAMLKSDTQKAVNIQETSLIRDMKDVRVSSEELIEGLESLMFSLGAEIEKTNRAGDKENSEELSAVINQGSEEE